MSNLLRRPPAARWIRNALAWVAAIAIGAPAFQVAHAAAPVPDFTLRLLEGKSTTLTDYRGKPVLVNFFHSK